MSTLNLLALAGGLGLFLYGMSMMGDGLKLAAGGRLRKLLETATTNRAVGVLVGLAVAAVIQSSSETTVMVVGFVNAGLMTLAQSVGVIMGANIGTTITAQIISLRLSTIAPLAVLIGIALLTYSKSKNQRHVGQIIAGLGMLFMGIKLMGDALVPLAGDAAFAQFMQTFRNPVLGILTGMLLTALIQSSSASIGILQVLAMQGLIALDGGIFLLLGMNIGSCVTALLSAMGTGVTARRAAVIHLLFNVFGVLLFTLLIWLLPVTDWIASLSPSNRAWQFANVHTIFNLATTLILFLAAKPLVRVSELIVPGKEARHEDMELKFIDERILSAPSVAVAQIVKEVDRMGGIARKNFLQAMNCFFTTDEAEYEALVREVSANEKVINFLNHEITHVLIKVNALDLSEQEYHVVGNLFHTISDLERIGDHAENIIEYAQKKREENLPFSPTALSELREMTVRVESIINQAVTIFHADVHDEKVFNMVMSIEQGIDERIRDLRNKHVDRLARGDCNTVSGMIFIDLLTNMERAADHAVNIAQSVNSLR